MKNIVIFEGIASSGKTTLEKLIAEKLPGSIIISENETLMPLIDNKDKSIAQTYLQKQLDAIVGNQATNLIVDRFHFTHAFRTQAELGDFSNIEAGLQKAGNVLVVLLTIKPELIKQRIEETTLLRKDNWKKGARGGTEEKAAYYTRQQEILNTFASSSHLPILVIDTTTKDWETYADLILTRVKI